MAIYGVGPLMSVLGEGRAGQITRMVLVEAWYYVVHFSQYAVVVPFCCRYLTLCW